MKLRVISNLVLFLVLIPIPVLAQSVSLGGGIQKPGDDRYVIAGSYRMYLNEHFSLNPDVAFSERSDSEEFCVTSVCFEGNALFRDVTVGMHALFTIPKDRFSFSLGGGAGAHFLKTETSLDSNDPTLPDIERSDSTVQPGLHFIGEFDVAVNDRLSIFLVNRSEFVRRFNDNFKLYGGVRWKF
jgi:hypothetical protein